MKKINLVIVFLILGNSVFSQNSNCKVVNNDLTGIYKGGCESGLANGNGVFTFE